MKLSEIYTSVQGEGPLTGDPTTFVRFGGCNMRCPGWPCDTMFAVDPKYRSTWDMINYIELFERTPVYPKHVCLTGGEPFMQKHEDLAQYCSLLYQSGYKIEVFTNGSFLYPEWLKHFNLQVMQDWKLEGSGEASKNLDNRISNVRRLQMTDGVKFVVTDAHDLDEAYEVWEYLMALPEAGLGPQFWVGAAWDRISDQEIIDFVMANELPWRLNVQIHKHLWNPDERRV